MMDSWVVFAIWKQRYEQCSQIRCLYLLSLLQELDAALNPAADVYTAAFILTHHTPPHSLIIIPYYRHASAAAKNSNPTLMMQWWLLRERTPSPTPRYPPLSLSLAQLVLLNWKWIQWIDAKRSLAKALKTPRAPTTTISSNYHQWSLCKRDRRQEAREGDRNSAT